MDRKKIKFIFQGIDDYLIGSICDDIELCNEINYPVYTKYFYPSYIIERLNEFSSLGIKFKGYGIWNTAEKKLLCIYPQDFLEQNLNYPVKYFKIVNKSKFKILGHKHFLGTILSLGIKRELLGDLIVEKNECFGITTDEIFEYLKNNLTEVANIPVIISEISANDIPIQSYEEINESVSSLRLDNLVTIIIKNSRNNAINVIDTGNVNINYVVEKEKSKQIKIGDVITVKKYGKFILDKILGESKKGKIRILIKKFI